MSTESGNGPCVSERSMFTDDRSVLLQDQHRMISLGRAVSSDMISILAFDEPHGPQSDNRPCDDAEYHTTVEFDR
jgi:hypothetical protein